MHRLPEMPPTDQESLRDQVRAWLHESDAAIPPLGAKAKHIRDPLHGSVMLAPHEVRLLDSWPMQRLRDIHQLGLAYLTFPSARHTRFEHALGVRFVAEQMLDRLADVRGGFTPRQRATVLAAALLHDVGHGVFSHASEAIIADHPALNAQFDPHGGALHEQIGALLITEDPLAACLEDAGIDPLAVAALLRHDAASLLQCDVPPELWGVISGPLDADKLDYFARDSYFSGIASAVDPERILRTLTVGPEAQLAITLAGAGALDQMLFDRVRMYADLYGHQKILAAEAMVRAIIETMLKRDQRGKHGHLYVRGLDGRSTPVKFDHVSDFLRMGDEAFLAAPTDLPDVAALQTRLQRRALLHRAYALSFETVRGASEEAYLRYLARMQQPAMLAQVRHAIQLRHPTIAPADLGVAAVRAPSMAGLEASVVGRDGRPVPMGSAFAGWEQRDAHSVPQHTVLCHFMLYRARIFVFCPPEVAPAVEATARAVLQAAWDDGHGEVV